MEAVGDWFKMGDDEKKKLQVRSSASLARTVNVITRGW